MVGAPTCRAVLRFRADVAIHARLSEIVAAEAECCAFLETSVTDAADAVVLTIAAPDDAGPILRRLVTAFSGR